MITVAGTDKALSEMTEGELAAIIANCTHTIKRRRYTNEAHLSYLQARVDACRLERVERNRK
jgi:hypothetical protein